jgi:hypothetical protein
MKIIVEDSDTIMKAHGLDNEEMQEALIKQMTIEIKAEVDKARVDKWQSTGLLEGIVDKHLMSDILEITENYIKELRPDGNYTDMDSAVLVAMRLLYNRAYEERVVEGNFTDQEKILQKVKQLYEALAKGFPFIEELHGNIDVEAELMHYVVNKMVEELK